MEQEQQIFKLHSEYAADRRPAAGYRVRWCRGFKEGNQFETLLGRYRLGQDVYDGECDCGS